ncbi:MAG: N-acetylmuramoyl-L-alanine amidase [Oscillospiraceae bacterium]|nr:N-acetylmuramoyl-L-alanine amidase [Oscillospiraceae bacterium]
MTKKICIEIGHRSPDTGAVSMIDGRTVRECDINLVVGLELIAQLERHGIEIFTNRRAWDGIPLPEYFKTAAKLKPSAGISVHSNSAVGTSATGKAKGFEVFRQTNLFSARSAELCRSIEAEIVLGGQVSRGVKVHFKQSVNAYINSIPAPYAYCELGFIDNPADYANFNTEAKQKAFAVAYAKGILKYLKVEWIPEIPEGPPAPIPKTYAVRVGAFKNKKSAEKLRAELRAKGYKAVIVEL